MWLINTLKMLHRIPISYWKQNSEQNFISSYDNSKNNNQKSSLEYKDRNRYYLLKHRIQAHEEEMPRMWYWTWF